MKKNYLLGILTALFPVYASPETQSLNVQDFTNFQHEINHEFPNFFSYFGHWGKHCVNRMFPEILDRLQLPQVEKDGKVVFKTGYFRSIQEIADQYGATAYVAGGVVRAILGYIYQELYDAYKAAPQSWGNINHFTSQEEFFGQFVSEWARKNPALDPLHVLGIGSDCDILVEGGTSDIQEELKKKIKDFMNGAEMKLGLREQQSMFKKVIFPPADVKVYADQIDRTTQQGGSTLDWMAFPLKNVQGVREIREPHKIFALFLEGKLDYIANNDVKDKQSIRGLRPLLELPFIELTESGQETLIKELNNIDRELSTDAKDQIAKAKRNGRFQGAGNRFSQTPWREVPVVKDNFPVYVLYKDFTQRDAQIQEKFTPLSMETFIANDTDNGVLYHGTKDQANLMAMLRGGLVMSNNRAGTCAAFGDGFYTTKNRDIAQGYACGVEGALLKFKVNTDSRARVLDLKDETHKAFYDSIAYETNRSLHEILRDHYHIDIIINGHVLILNEAVIEKDELKKIIRIAKMIMIKKINFTVDQVITLLEKDFTEEEIETISAMPKINEDRQFASFLKFLSDSKEFTLELIRNNVKIRFYDLEIFMEDYKDPKETSKMLSNLKTIRETYPEFCPNSEEMQNILSFKQEYVGSLHNLQTLPCSPDKIIVLLDKGLSDEEIKKVSEIDIILNCSSSFRSLVEVLSYSKEVGLWWINENPNPVLDIKNLNQFKNHDKEPKKIFGIEFKNHDKEPKKILAMLDNLKIIRKKYPDFCLSDATADLKLELELVYNAKESAIAYITEATALKSDHIPKVLTLLEKGLNGQEIIKATQCEKYFPLMQVKYSDFEKFLPLLQVRYSDFQNLLTLLSYSKEVGLWWIENSSTKVKFYDLEEFMKFNSPEKTLTMLETVKKICDKHPNFFPYLDNMNLASNANDSAIKYITEATACWDISKVLALSEKDISDLVRFQNLSLNPDKILQLLEKELSDEEIVKASQIDNINLYWNFRYLVKILSNSKEIGLRLINSNIKVRFNVLEKFMKDHKDPKETLQMLDNLSKIRETHPKFWPCDTSDDGLWLKESKKTAEHNDYIVQCIYSANESALSYVTGTHDLIVEGIPVVLSLSELQVSVLHMLKKHQNNINYRLMSISRWSHTQIIYLKDLLENHTLCNDPFPSRLELLPNYNDEVLEKMRTFQFLQDEKISTLFLMKISSLSKEHITLINQFNRSTKTILNQFNQLKKANCSDEEMKTFFEAVKEPRWSNITDFTSEDIKTIISGKDNL